MINNINKITSVVRQFPDIQYCLRSLDHDTSNENLKNYLQKARDIRNQLLATALDPVLLHGDLHHENIIKHGDNWVVIDSKAVTGNPAYEPSYIYTQSYR